MVALIFGWGEGDSNLVETVVGIYDSEESIPEQYKKRPITEDLTPEELHKNKGAVYYGLNKVPENDIDKFNFGCYCGSTYSRVQPIILNEPITYQGMQEDWFK
jgi:hypothetical protein